MSDTYRPRGRGPYDRAAPRGEYAHHQNYPRPSDRGYYSRPLSPPRQPRASRPDHYQPPRNGGQSNGFTFRGAAGNNNDYHRQPEFTFRSTGPPAPTFPPEPRRSPPRHPHAAASRRGQGKHFPGRGRGNPLRGYRRFGPRPAHERDLLNRAHRGSTPEQLEGMNADSQLRFRDVDNMSSSSDELDGPRAKRARIAASAEKPKWSNPDPYTALPPPEAATGPKRDIVQVIRKAKTEAAQSAASNTAIERNADFISFNFDDEPVIEAVPHSSPRREVDHASLESGEVSAREDFGNSLEAHGQSTFREDLDDFMRAQGLHDSGSTRQDFCINLPPKPSFAMHAPYSRSDNEHIDHNIESLPVAIDDRSLKRKRQDDPTGLTSDWYARPGTNSTPWFQESVEQTTTVGLRLHMEICDFYDYVRPNEEAQAVRLDLIRRISDVLSVWPGNRHSGLQVHAFGSFASGLYLPVADMDLVVLSPAFLQNGRPTIGQDASSIRTFARKLQKSGIARAGTLVPIIGARVPLIKFIDNLTAIKVDLSFENPSGLTAIATFNDWKRQYPAMPAIVVLIKQLLAMHGQNEVHTGGMGGFTIICLVVSMMQHMPEVQSGSMSGELHYGDLLMNFLELYGGRFDYTRTGIVMTPPKYYNKHKISLVRCKEDRLTIVDPNNSENDISGGTRNIADIFDIFKAVHARIQHRLADLYQGRNLTDSILGCCWGADYTSFTTQRDIILLGYKSVMAAGGPTPLLPIPDLSTLFHPTIGGPRQQKRKRFDDQRESFERKKFNRLR